MFVFLLFSLIGYRETAFAYAVSSAGVAHSVSKACGQGKLESCGCDPKSQRGNGGFGSSSILADWRWSGCSHNMDFGVKFSRFLLDSRQRGQDIHSRIHLHNSHVGRTVSRICFFRYFHDSRSLVNATDDESLMYYMVLYCSNRSKQRKVLSLMPLKSQNSSQAWELSNPIIRNFSLSPYVLLVIRSLIDT